jgi:hypothetical protein
VFFHFTNIDNHGNHQGNTEQAPTRWWCLVALHEATDVLHPAICITLYCPGGMVIKIVIKSVTSVYILDYKLINYSFMFTIYLIASAVLSSNPISCVFFVLDWVQLSNLCRKNGKQVIMVGVFVLCV